MEEYNSDSADQQTADTEENTPETDNTEAQENRAPEIPENTEEESTYGDSKRKSSPFADSPYEMHFNRETAQIPEKKKHKKHPALKNWTAVLVITLAVAAASSGITALVVGANCNKQLKLMNRAVEEKIAAMKDVPGQEPSKPAEIPHSNMTPGQIYNANAPAVVSVMCTLSQKDQTGQAMEMESAGSGFFVDASGYVVTNCHVVEDAEKVKVRAHDGELYDAKIVGKDASNDVALLKIEAEDVQPVEMGTCESLSVGDQVVAIGHPLGNQNAILTVGYVSAKNQVVYTDGSSMDMVQTDAAINAGNSGGPLFDANGRVIGITTAKYSGYASGGASIEGVGYAIPIDDVISILDELNEFGKVKHSYLGVMVKDVDRNAQEYGIPEGAFIAEVTEGMAAEKAGIKEKDVIVELGGYEISSVADLTRVLRKFQVGEEVTAKVWRGGKYQYVSIALEEKPEADSQPEETKPQTPQQPQELPDGWPDIFDYFFGN